ncbi:MAG: hypothetical protein RR977_00930 [Oscillospiraceae bacterium]
MRCNETIYYGDMNDPYVVMLQIRSSTEQKDLKLSDIISIQMMSTDTSVPPDKLILKKAEKQGLYQALDIASVWLDRTNK